MQACGVSFPATTGQGLLENFKPTETEIRQLFKELWSLGLNPDDAESHKALLSNGLTVGEFCLWYICSNRTLCSTPVPSVPVNLRGRKPPHRSK